MDDLPKQETATGSEFSIPFVQSRDNILLKVYPTHIPIRIPLLLYKLPFQYPRLPGIISRSFQTRAFPTIKRQPPPHISETNTTTKQHRKNPNAHFKTFSTHYTSNISRYLVRIGIIEYRNRGRGSRRRHHVRV
jgi:hypothetical protein